MNKRNFFILSGVCMMLVGCTTSSQVQEMIDASHKDYTDQVSAHEKSIEVLKKSSMTGLEKSATNEDALEQLRLELEAISEKLDQVNSYAEASKVLASANTVKVADLETAVAANHQQVEETVQKLADINQLFENVMLRHYEMIVQSANEAMTSLKAKGAGVTNAPVKLAEPIEIVAPDTSMIKTNGAAKQ